MGIPLINGVIPPMVTPFTDEGAVDYGKYVRNLEKWNSDRLGGYLVLGSNSEASYLSQEEKCRLIEATVEHASKDRVILAGTGMESAQETIRLTNTAAEYGVSAALILTPFYYLDHMSDEALVRYFAFVADHTDIPILLYNVPKFTHKNVSIGLVRELSRHPNIVGMKDSSGNVPQLAAFLSVVEPGWKLMPGTAAAWFPALTFGLTAGIFALANCAPNECAAIQQSYLAGDMAGSRERYFRMMPVNTALTATYGIAGLKHAVDLMGYEGGAVRSPLLPLTPVQKAAVEGVLRAAGLID